MLIERLRPNGDVLMIGFGNGKAAHRIVSYHPKSLTIIEESPLFRERAQQWLKEHPQIVWITDVWQKALHPLARFDAIYCELTEASALWPELTKIRYTDHDLDTFCASAVQSAPDQVFRFLHELLYNGQITEEQLGHMLKKYHLKGSVPRQKKSYAQLAACLKICLQSHMRANSLFAAPVDDFAALYDNPVFHEIALDPYAGIYECEKGILVEKFGS